MHLALLIVTYLISFLGLLYGMKLADEIGASTCDISGIFLRSFDKAISPDHNRTHKSCKSSHELGGSLISRIGKCLEEG
jgi:hypothetical protein